MAQLVLGMGMSHSTMVTLDASLSHELRNEPVEELIAG